MTMSTLTILGIVALMAGLAQWIAWWLRLPAILFLLGIGLVAGPLTGFLDPDALFGELLFPMVALAVSIILFEGSLTLKFSELRGIGNVVRNLVTVGALVTWVITALLAYHVLGLSFDLAVLFGAVVVVTGPTVIVPMLRTVRPNRRIAEVLRWEGIVIDPLGALFAVLAFNFVVSGVSTATSENAALLFFELTIVGAVLGLAAGFALGEVLRRYWLPDYLRSPVTLLLVLFVFAASDALVHESGLLAVTVFGMVLANRPGIEVEDILDFKESLTVVLIGGLFIVLAARLDLGALVSIGAGALVVVLGVILVARPVAVFVATLGSDLTWQEKSLIGWIGPRGIVCASVAAVFSLRLEELDVPDAGMLVPLAFSVIIGTVVIQGLSSKWIAHALGVRDPAPTGFLVLGAGAVARMLGQVLSSLDRRVVLVDDNWQNISEARMAGLETYYGNPVSDHADRHLELTGIGHLIAASGRTDRDVMASQHFRGVFGAQQVFELPPSAEGEQPDNLRVSSHRRGRRLFAPDANYNQLLGSLNRGAETRVTQLTADFDLDAYRDQYDGRHLVLFVIGDDDRLTVITDQAELPSVRDCRLISLVLPEDKNEKVD